MDNSDQPQQPQPSAEPTFPQANPNMGEKNTGMAVIAYLLFFIPLLMGEKSTFVKYHVNQGLLLFIFAVGVNIVSRLIPFIGWTVISPLGGLISLVLLIIGIMHAVNGETKPLPVIGNYQLIK